jgi:FkbM family methyltransferase
MTDIPFYESSAFDPLATEGDILACFRLILGRHPQAQEWLGHVTRVGQPLSEVISTYVNSAEFHNRSLMGHVPTSVELVECAAGFQMYACADDPHVGSGVIRDKNYEPQVSCVFRERLKPGMHVLDVGANIGFYTMLAASRVGDRGSVTAVEPNPANVSLILASQQRNSFGNIRVIQAAAYDKWTTLRLFSDYSNGTVMSSGGGGSSVMAFPLGAFLRDQQVDLMKIDVEGAEGRSILGMIEVIDRCHPVVFSEFTPGFMPANSGMSGEQYLNLFISRGYRIQVLHPGGPADCGTDPRRVMAEYELSGLPHLDILCEV